MTREQVWSLLLRIQALDHRTLGHGDKEAWHELLEDIRYEDALVVLREHRRNSTEWVTPAHIVQGVKKLREERLRAADAPFEPVPGQPVAVELRMRRRANQQLADGATPPERPVLPVGRRPLELMGPAPEAVAEGARKALLRVGAADASLRVACPVAWCRAAPGAWCVFRGSTRSKRVHPSRWEASRAPVDAVQRDDGADEATGSDEAL